MSYEKGILEFDLTDPHGRNAHKRAIKATNAYLVLWNLEMDVFRQLRKYDACDNFNMNDENLTKRDLLSFIEMKFSALLADHMIYVDEELE